MNAQHKVQRAIGYYKADKLDRAEALFREVHSVAAVRSDASYGLGLVAFRRRLPDEAYGWFTMVEREAAHFADSRYYMAIIDQQRGMIPSALRVCSDALEKDHAHQWALALARELRSYPKSSGVAGASWPAAPLRAAIPKPAGQPLETELWLPKKSQLDDYRERKLAKEQTDFIIDNWLRYPVWQRAVYVLFITPIFVGLIIAFARLAIKGAL